MATRSAASPVSALQRQLAEIERQISFNKLAAYKPYPKQLEFHHAGGERGTRERLLMAGNQLGKTLSASMETAMHLTAMYPKWWTGAVFLKPTTGWAASITSQGTRDSVQRLLLGLPGQHGTGAIPKALIVETKKSAHGVADSIETIIVKHVPRDDNKNRLSDGTSRITLKTYDQGRERWQGDTLNFVWFDEEPDEEIYNEGLTRTNATGGLTYMTFTPLLGMSDVVRKFLIEKRLGTHVTRMTIEDALHYTPEERLRIAAAYPIHEREARVLGVPILGSGRVFPIEEEAIRENTLQIPAHWPRICGIDFGWDHETAVVWLAWDRDQDIVHIYDVYKRREQTPIVHAAAIRARGAWIPCAWPHDGLQHDRGAGVIHAEQYRAQGVNMLKVRATYAPAHGQKEGDGGYNVEPGVMDMLDRMQTGRLKVAKHLSEWFEEFRMYHRKDGKVVAEGDDAMSATRYALMMLRRAVVQAPVKRIPVAGFRPQDAGMGMLG